MSQNTVLNQVKETVEGTIQVMLLCGEHSDHLWAIFRKKEVTKLKARDEFILIPLSRGCSSACLLSSFHL